jgi:hypothetical protein
MNQNLAISFEYIKENCKTLRELSHLEEIYHQIALNSEKRGIKNDINITHKHLNTREVLFS